MARTKELLLLLFFSCLAIEGSVLAQTTQKLSLQQLVKEADLIVKARVQDVSTQETPDRSNLTTVVVLAVEQQWKGPNVSTVIVRLPGGSAGEITQRVMGQPEFSLGEEVILFLKKQADGRYATVGAKQGKFTVTTDSQKGKKIVEDVTGMKQEQDDFIRHVRKILGDY